jgi:hypothetical protein
MYSAWNSGNQEIRNGFCVRSAHTRLAAVREFLISQYTSSSKCGSHNKGARPRVKECLNVAVALAVQIPLDSPYGFDKMNFIFIISGSWPRVTNPGEPVSDG